MAAKKGGGGLGRRRASDQARAAYMVAHGVRRTTFRDPITGSIVAIGTVPGTKNKAKGQV